MRRALLGLFTIFLLGGCSVLQGAYDDEASRQCRRDNRGVEREMCPRARP